MKNTHGGDIYRHENTVDFSANINPLGIPRKVRIALADSIEKAQHYPDVECTRLREKLSAFYNLPDSWFLCGNGAADIIYLVVTALKPRKALLTAPAFSEYEQALLSAGTEILFYELEEEQEFNLDEAFLDCLTPDLDMVFLCNPNNPTGQAITASFMEEVLKRCRENYIILLVDECFNGFLDEPEQYTVVPFMEEYDNLIVVNAFTKLYAIPGIRLGYGIVNNEKIMAFIQQVTQPWNVSVMAQEAGLAAMEAESYVKRTKELIPAERAYLKEALEGMGYKVFGSRANFLFFKGPQGLYGHCLENGFLIRDCQNYRGLKPGFYRIAVRTHEENESLMKVIEQYEGDGGNDGEINYDTGDNVECGEEFALGWPMQDFQTGWFQDGPL